MLYNHQLGILIFIVTQMHSINSKEKIELRNNVSAENILRKKIFKNYDKIVIPSNQDGSLKVLMYLGIQTAELNYEKSQMDLSTIIYMYWNDYRLTWEPDENDQITYIMVDSQQIWQPDIISNNVDANIEGDRSRMDKMVTCNGSVSWIKPAQYSINCQTDLTNWPHNNPTGVLTLSSLMYSGNVLNLTIDETYNTGGETLEYKHSEWNTANVYMKKFQYEYPCCPDLHFIYVEYNITLRQNIHQYFSIIYVPALCCASLNLITFWLPYADNYYRKLFSNLFNALFVALNIFIVYSKVPNMTSSVPLIVVYYTHSLGLIAITAVITTTVKNISTKNRPLSREVTQILHSRCLVYLGSETNDITPTTDCRALCESNEMNAHSRAHLNKRLTLAKLIDRMCFIVFAFVYLILLRRFMP